jgi:NAD(P)-dependent dehydrogenase (short-subunit alcohol dehydrogenase family)
MHRATMDGRKQTGGARVIDLSGARVVLTGAAGGVGRALCATLEQLGAAVVSCDLPGTDLAGEAHHFDLRDRAAVLAAAGAVLAGGVPSVVILNAGWTRADRFADCTADVVEDELAGNFTGAAHFSQAFLPAMRAGAGNRAFVFVASVNALSHHGNPAYSAAKAAMLAWSRAIAVEEGRHGIRSNAVIPASIRTAAWADRLRADPALLDRLAAIYPLGRIVTTDEVAAAVAFLASPAASGITGTTLTVDAGLMAGNLPFLDAIT